MKGKPRGQRKGKGKGKKGNNSKGKEGKTVILGDRGGIQMVTSVNHGLESDSGQEAGQVLQQPPSFTLIDIHLDT
eukprot:651887-Amphidinium_carterae.1